MSQVVDQLNEIGNVFTPGSPVNEKDLFAGRIEQIRTVLNATGQRGYHAVLYGERGTGKTSLANIIKSMLPTPHGWIVPRINCDGTDTYSSLWKKAFRDINFTSTQLGIGFTADKKQSSVSLADNLPEIITPDDVRRTLVELSNQVKVLIAFDEFDRIADEGVSVLMADTIKMLSDYSVNVTVLLIGVADSVDGLIAGHLSIERALIQIPMPRMSPSETGEIVKKGCERLKMGIDRDAFDEIVALSQGLPYITHLLALQSGRSALYDNRRQIRAKDIEDGIKRALDSWQQSTTKAYYDAVQSSQPGNIYKQVLLACALAETDDMGFFSAASVRSPLRVLTAKDYDIPNFAQHLKNFSEESRGGIINRTGEKRRIRYRFSSPLLRPYIVMRGFSDNLITRKQMSQLAPSPEPKKAR